MLVAEPRRALICNLDLATSLFAGLDGKVIARDSTGKSIPLATYNSAKASEEAVRILIERIEHAPTGAKIISMPTDDEVARQLNHAGPYHHIDGKKTKGHGAS